MVPVSNIVICKTVMAPRLHPHSPASTIPLIALHFRLKSKGVVKPQSRSSSLSVANPKPKLLLREHIGKIMADESRRSGGRGGRGAAAAGAVAGGEAIQPHAGVTGSYYDEKKLALGSEEVSQAKRIVLKSADMMEDLQKEAINCAISAFDKHTVEKDIAEYIKKEFDKNHGPTWHCIVGRSFGSYVTHETNYFIYFYLDSKAVLLFKSG